VLLGLLCARSARQHSRKQDARTIGGKLALLARVLAWREPSTFIRLWSFRGRRRGSYGTAHRARRCARNGRVRGACARGARRERGAGRCATFWGKT